jgi:hypothetical protein
MMINGKSARIHRTGYAILLIGANSQYGVTGADALIVG